MSDNGVAVLPGEGNVHVSAGPAPPPAAGPGPRMPRRTAWVDLPATTPEGEEAYPGFRVRVWVNFPVRLFEELKAAADEAQKGAILRRVILEHNGWRDADGEPFPPADDPGFYDALPQELLTLIIVAINEAVMRLPNSLLRTRQPSGAT